MDSDICTKDKFSDRYDGHISLREALVLKRIKRSEDEIGDVVTNVPHLVTHHSPGGYEFGYGGSGPADLALNVCQVYLNMQEYQGKKTKCYDGQCWQLAWMLHQDFKREFIAGTPNEGAVIPFGLIDTWFDLHMTDDLLNECRAWVEEEIA